MNDLHEPSPEFLNHLEWQTRTELRRRQRFAPVARRLPRLARLARSAALVLLSLSVGASAVLAVGRLQDSRELGVRLEGNRVLVELAERRVTAAQEQVEVQRLRYEEGLVSVASARDAEQRLAGMVLERDHLRLDREELNAARRVPDLRLSAPLVGPRDFVSEHLRLDRAHAASAAEHLEEDQELIQRRYEQGFASSTTVDQARRDAEVVHAEVERHDERLALRADFLLGRMDAESCERRDLVTAAGHRLSDLMAQVEFVQRELERAEALESAGVASGQSAPLRERLDVLDVELQLVELELELLR